MKHSTERKRLIKLGIFVLSTGALLIAMLALFTGLKLTNDAHRYYVNVPGAEGIQVGTGVFVRGVKVGRVEALQLFHDDRNSVRLVLDVDSNVPINKDAEALLEMKGVTGLKVVNIRKGTGNAGTLPPNSYIPHGETALEKIRNESEQLLTEAAQLINTANETLQRIAGAAQQVDLTRVDRILADSHALVENLSQTNSDLRSIIVDSKAPIKRSLNSANEAFARVENMTEDAEQVLKNMQLVSADLRSVVRKNDRQLDATVENLRDATRSFKQLGRELAHQPNLLLFSSSPEERQLP